MLLADVALPVPIGHAFSYLVPEALGAAVRAGARVICPFGGRRLVGVVLALRDAEPPRGAKPLARLVDGEPAVPEDLLAFLRDLAAYYFAPIGEVVRLALPPVERDAAREVEDRGLFHRATGIAGRRVQWVGPTPRVEASGALPGQAAAILAHVRAVGAEPVARLEARWGNARAAVKRLAAAGLVELDERDAPDGPIFSGDPVARDAP